MQGACLKKTAVNHIQQDQFTAQQPERVNFGLLKNQ
jgi:hypothetical protein